MFLACVVAAQELNYIGFASDPSAASSTSGDGEAARTQVGDAGGVEALLALLMHGHSYGARGLAAHALAGLALDPGLCEAIAAGGAVKPLVRMLVPTVDGPGSSEATLVAARERAGERAAITEEGIGTVEEAAASAMEALAVLGCDSHVHQLQMAQGTPSVRVIWLSILN